MRLLTPTVSIVLKGTQEAIQNVSLGSVHAQADVSGLAAGEHAVEVRVLVPQGVTVESIVPSTVRLRIPTS
jgi:YbbR domain-containing protein